jgi:hypothetical protein
MRKLDPVASRVAPEPSASLEREWWLSALLVLQSPRAVFRALRDDSDAAAAARQEPVTVIAYLAGISSFLLSSTAGRLLDDAEFDATLVVIECVFAGAILAAHNYWLGGGALHLGARSLGSTGSFRRSRHALAFAMPPLVVALVLVWPVMLAVYGGDLFRSGGSDAGAGHWVFQGILFAALAWALALLIVGVRTVHEWSWLRSVGAVGAAVVVLGLTSLAFALL